MSSPNLSIKSLAQGALEIYKHHAEQCHGMVWGDVYTQTPTPAQSTAFVTSTEGRRWQGTSLASPLLEKAQHKSSAHYKFSVGDTQKTKEMGIPSLFRQTGFATTVCSFQTLQVSRLNKAGLEDLLLQGLESATGRNTKNVHDGTNHAQTLKVYIMQVLHTTYQTSQAQFLLILAPFQNF